MKIFTYFILVTPVVILINLLGMRSYLYATQHTCCRLRNRFTLERLIRHFGLEE